MTNYNWVSKRVADGWLNRYRKEMSQEEFSKWSTNFDKSTIVYVDVDNVQFLTKDYVKCKLEAEMRHEINQSKT
jgi:hypothetical protein